MLNTDDREIITAALSGLAARQPFVAGDIRELLAKISTGAALDDAQRLLAAIALQGHAMVNGPRAFDAVHRIAGELGAGEELRACLESWLAWSRTSHRIT